MLLIDDFKISIEAFTDRFNYLPDILLDCVQSNLLPFWIIFFLFPVFVALKFFVFIEQNLFMTIERFNQEISCFLENWLIELEKIWSFFWNSRLKKIIEIVFGKMLEKSGLTPSDMLWLYQF